MVRIGGGTQKLQADYGASTAQLFTELGYAMRVSPALTLEPYAGLIWSDQRIRGSPNRAATRPCPARASATP